VAGLWRQRVCKPLAYEGLKVTLSKLGSYSYVKNGGNNLTISDARDPTIVPNKKENVTGSSTFMYASQEQPKKTTNIPHNKIEIKCFLSCNLLSALTIPNDE